MTYERAFSIEFSERFNVVPLNIYKIITRQTWKNI